MRVRAVIKYNADALDMVAAILAAEDGPEDIAQLVPVLFVVQDFVVVDLDRRSTFRCKVAHVQIGWDSIDTLISAGCKPVVLGHINMHATPEVIAELQKGTLAVKKVRLVEHEISKYDNYILYIDKGDAG